MIKNMNIQYRSGRDTLASKNSTHRSPWKAIAQLYDTFVPLMWLKADDGSHILF